jgi:hypothetical protein
VLTVTTLPGFPLEEAAEALARVRQGTHGAAVVLIPASLIPASLDPASLDPGRRDDRAG